MPKNLRRPPSALSTKQLARTVLDGRKVTFLLGKDPVEGYLCGMDDYHWMVVTCHGEKYLIHKGSTPAIHIADTATYDAEINRKKLEEVVGPFRRWVETEHFGRTSASASEEKEAV